MGGKRTDETVRWEERDQVKAGGEMKGGGFGKSSTFFFFFRSNRGTCCKASS